MESSFRLLQLIHCFRLSLSLGNCRVFLIHFAFVYTNGNLVSGQVLERRENSTYVLSVGFSFLLSLCSHNSLLVFYTEGSLVKGHLLSALHLSLKYHIISISLRFLISTSLVQKQLSSTPLRSRKHHIISSLFYL